MRKYAQPIMEIKRLAITNVLSPSSMFCDSASFNEDWVAKKKVFRGGGDE